MSKMVIVIDDEDFASSYVRDGNSGPERDLNPLDAARLGEAVRAVFVANWLENHPDDPRAVQIALSEAGRLGMMVRVIL